MDAAAEAAIGRCNNPLSANKIRKTDDPLRDEFGVFDTLVAWLTTPGRISLSSGNLTSCQTFHSCSCLTLPASNE